MGYGHYKVWRNGREIHAGYDVRATCEENGCDSQIWRGLGCLCGDSPGGGEYGCGGYFCEDHLYIPVAEKPSWNCRKCLRQADDDTKEI